MKETHVLTETEKLIEIEQNKKNLYVALGLNSIHSSVWPESNLITHITI